MTMSGLEIPQRIPARPLGPEDRPEVIKPDGNRIKPDRNRVGPVGEAGGLTLKRKNELYSTNSIWIFNKVQC